MKKMVNKWRELEIDALICPAFPSCAFKIENASDLSTLAYHTMIWNLVHYPCGVVPVGEVQGGEHEIYEDEYNDMWTKAIRRDIKDSVGMPLGV